MSLWRKLFGKVGANLPDQKSYQLPGTLVAKEFGEVNLKWKPLRNSVEVGFTILMEPQGKESEGWQTGVALDASRSMLLAYGKNVIAGQTSVVNQVEPLARKFTAYLANNLDEDCGTTVIYWACGDGSQLELVGNLTAAQCEGAKFPGPRSHGFGTSTQLTPAIRYFAERYQAARRGLYIFITDGELLDLEAVKYYTAQLCREIEAKQRNPIKCVLIGVGNEINYNQLAELDDLNLTTNVDIWDYKIGEDMRSLVEIFAEIVSENQIIAPSAMVYDAAGQLVKKFSDGLPAKASFEMAANSRWFDLEVTGGGRIRQYIVPTDVKR